MSFIENALSVRRQMIATALLTGLTFLPLTGFGAAGPAIVTNQPASQVILQDSPVTFTVGADGTAPIAYFWLRNGAFISGATSSAYTIANVTPADDFAGFSVIVSNSVGYSTSAVATLRVDPGIPGTTVTTQPLIDINTQTWRYNQAGIDLQNTWQGTNFSDSSWSSGQALIGVESTPDAYLPLTFRAALTSRASGGPVTAYFRTHFNFSGDPTMAVLVTSNLMDDGAVFYLNGAFAGQLRVSGAPNHTFTTDADTTKDPEGLNYEVVMLPATNLVRGDNVLAVELHQSGATSSDAVFGVSMAALVTNRVADLAEPVVTQVLPFGGQTVAKLLEIELFFSEQVTNVDAGDLLINGVPATNVTPVTWSQYVFRFPQPPTGQVQVAWATNHGITDLSLHQNAFAGGSWTYNLDPNATLAPLWITEFLAANRSGYPNAIRDEDGEYSDWIEIFNSGTTLANLGGWFLTDDPANLTKWEFPAASLAGNRYLVVFTSGKDRRPVNGQLHANFNLAREGAYLALVSPATNVVMQYSPTYPPQNTGVSYGMVSGTTNTFGFFVAPTPGAANSSAGAGFAPAVKFSRASGTFAANFSLTLSTDDPAAEIRYVLGTNTPTASSTLYAGPITVSGTVMVRARAYRSGLLPGPLRSEAYLKLDATVLNRTSDLPIVVLHDYGQGDPPTTKPDQFVICQVFMPKNGVAALTNAPDQAFHGIFHRRGSSTAGQAKANLLVEAQDEVGNDMDVEFAGLPAESDWVLYAPNNFDRALIHNPVAHDIYRNMSYYSSRNQYVEVFLQDDSGALNPIRDSDYNGLYSVLEKIKTGKNRLDIGKVRAENTNSPAITGGYLFSRDRANTGESQASYAGETSINWLDPDYLEISSTAFTPQRNYLSSWFAEFGAALQGASWTNRETGYAKYIDVTTFVDYHIQNVVTFNVDGLRLSGYFFKERLDPEVPGSGKLKWGPQWDYDRTQGSADGRDFNPRQWLRTTAGADNGTDMFNASPAPVNYANPWYARLVRDIDFWQAWIDRYQMWRQSVLATTNMYGLIESHYDRIRNVQPREQAKWGSWNAPRSGSQSAAGWTHNFPGTYRGEIDFMKLWYSNRLDFIDGNFLAMPRLSRVEGPVSPNTQVTLTGPAGATIYYTLDGSDPRPRGGAAGSPAQIYNGPITITGNARLMARAYNAAHNNQTGAYSPPLSSKWSGLASATYVVATPQLAVTEIMFDPRPAPAGSAYSASDYEFVELKNIGVTPIALNGYQFTNGVTFVFSNTVPTLQPGQYVLVVRNQAAFASRHPGVTNIAGQFLANLDNLGERLTLIGPMMEIVQDFKYNNWYRLTEGNGFSLVLANENALFSSYTNAAAWRISALEDGSPGVVDPAPATIPPVYISEVLAYPPAGGQDAIELYNPNAFAVEVGDWYLSDAFGTPKKYRIPAGTTIPANGYRVFTAAEFNAPGAPGGFGLSSEGDDAYLFSGNADGKLTGYYHGFGFGASPAGASFGRLVVTTTGADKLVLQTAASLGTNNAGPVVGPVVVSEIMFRPPDLLVGTNLVDNEVDEFIELHNFSSQPVALYDQAAPTNTWKLRKAVDFTFAQGVILPAGGYALVVSFNPATDPLALTNFINRYQVPANVPVFGPYSGKLDNSSEEVELVRPGTPVLLTGTGLYEIPEILADKVNYEDTTPWPCGTDGTGNSLQRLQTAQFGNDPANWVADVPTAGAATVPKLAGLPTIVQQPQPAAIPVGSSASFSVGLCGLPPFTYQWRFEGTNLPGATNAIYSVNNAALDKTGGYAVVVANAAGSVTSQVANLYVQLPPGISAHPTNLTVLGYTTASFSVTPSGTPPFQYEWRFDSSPIPGGTNQTLVLTDVQGSQAGQYRVLVYNSAGAILSSIATLSVNLPAKIWTQPADLKTTNGLTVNLTVGATGAGLLSYQWFFNGQPLAGATGASLGLTNVTPALQGQYGVLVSNLYGVELSRTANLQVLVVPGYLQKPSNTVARVGEAVSFHTVVTGSVPMRIKWSRAASTLYGYDYADQRYTLSPTNPAANVLVTNLHSTMTLASVQLTDGFYYQCTVTNEAKPVGTSSQLIFLSVVAPPWDTRAVAGSTVTLRAQVGGPSQTYKWRYAGADIAGATNLTLVLTNVTAGRAGQYEFVVTTGAAGNPTPGTRSFPVQLTVTETGSAPEITEQPTNRVVLTNLNTVLLVGAAGTDPLGFQWYRDATNLVANGTNWFLVLTNLQVSNSALYQVVVTNAYGAVTSAPAQVLVGVPPAFTTQPTNLAKPVGGEAAFVTVATGTAPLAYQWYFNGTQALSGAVSSSLVLDPVTETNSGSYQLVASNTLGVVTSQVATLTVQIPPAIVQGPQSVATNAGATVEFAVTASGTEPLRYQWWLNSAPLAGATNRLLILEAVQTANLGAYTVEVSNLVGRAVGGPATLSFLNNDTDNDGIPDDWEQRYGLVSNNPNDALLDPDGDGMNNLQEYLAGTDPTSAASVLKLEYTLTGGAGASVFQFNAVSNKSYTVQYQSQLATNGWLRLLDIGAAPTNRQVGITNSGTSGSRFLRIATPQLP